MQKHFFYLARCSDDSLYAGTCVDLKAREETHNAGKGAKYTRSRRPVTFVYSETFRTLSAARKREAEVKRWPAGEKRALLSKKKSSKKRRKKKAA
ncbi:MAG TPA: GIY-YIG nuclease family protein [Candidatus Peribacteria bacterium]|nr:GIY-YIG nuclease family protein [Candidatus Peribacteria bacterium]